MFPHNYAMDREVANLLTCCWVDMSASSPYR